MAQARALLDGLPDGGLNIAYEAMDRHVLAGRGKNLALRTLTWPGVRSPALGTRKCSASDIAPLAFRTSVLYMFSGMRDAL